jgi:protein-disulfide isomerase
VPDLTSASVPPLGADDHVRGAGETLIVYADLACPQCAAAWPEIVARRSRVVFRHFPLAGKRPRAPALHAAAEAAGMQGRFFEMVDSLFADRGRIDDPHLWERAETLGLDLARFDADRRSAAVERRVRRDFESGVRAGVTGTPALFPGER